MLLVIGKNIAYNKRLKATMLSCHGFGKQRKKPCQHIAC
jgi:hypothetical protein